MIVVIESPLAGDVEVNRAYLRACLRFSLLRGESPFASHGLYALDGVLDDLDPLERNLGIQAGLEFYRTGAAKLCVVCDDLGISRVMREGIKAAKAAGVEVVNRTIAPVSIQTTIEGRPATVSIPEPRSVRVVVPIVDRCLVRLERERERVDAFGKVEQAARALAGARENEKHERQRADEHAATIVGLRVRLAELEAAAEADERK